MQFEKNILFENACRIRPISAFHPEILLEINDKEFRRYLTADGKMLWFHWYCLEQGIRGKIETTFLSIEDLGVTNVRMEDGQFCETKVYKEYWKATVYMNDVETGSATSSGTFMLVNNKERDDASNILRKNAIGAALSQAGFGVISGFDMTANDIAQLCAEAAKQNQQPSPTENAPAAAFVPATQTSPIPNLQQPNTVQDCFFGSEPQVQFGNQIPQTSTAPQTPSASFTNPASVGSAPAPMPPAQPTQPQIDPLDAAKAVVWGGNGPQKGKSLGQILGEPGGRKFLQFIANDFSPRSDAGRVAKNAAAMILQSI